MTGKADFKGPRLNTILKYKGVFSWKILKRFIRSWFESNNFIFFEKKYKEKPGQYGVELEVTLVGEKKIDGFYKHTVTLDLHIWDSVPVEVIKDGQKNMMDDGRIKLDFDGAVTWDYEGQFEGSTFFKKLESFLTKHVINEDIDSIHWDSLYYEVNRFKNEVENLLNMETSTLESPYHG